MAALSTSIAASAWKCLGGNAAALDHLRFVGQGGLASTFFVSDFAAATIAVAALSIGELTGAHRSSAPSIVVDRRLASMWFGWSIRPLGWALPSAWDPIAGDYRAKDGWIRLHTNAPHHRAAAQRVLNCGGARPAVAYAVAEWEKAKLEEAVIDAGGCAAQMRSIMEWANHPQGRAVAAEPLIDVVITESGGWPSPRTASESRPLSGIRVLDLTRVLAGPIATRFLAGYGAEVLRIDPPGWDEPGVIPEVTLGKRCARLDLKQREGCTLFESLLAKADVLVHGYRPCALDRLGYDAARRRTLSPGLIDVCLDAYGWSGTWAQRRGFDSLVQMSTGIAAAGMDWQGADQPVPLPVQALDHATGYLLAAAAIRGLFRRQTRGAGTLARLSLARTAKFLIDLGCGNSESPLSPESSNDLESTVESTEWGKAQRVLPPAVVDNAPMHWSLPASGLGSAIARWED